MRNLLCSIAAISVLGAADAHAQNVDAETLFAEGEKQMAAGKLDEACESFAASNRIEQRAGTLLNLGQCQEQRGKLASAWVAFRESLTRAKDPAKRQFATDRIAAIEPRLSSITIELPAASRIADLVVLRDGQPVDVALLGRAIPVDGGPHTIEARATGRTAWTTTVEVGRESDRAVVSVPLLEVAGAIAAPIPSQPAREPRTHSGLTIAFGTVALAGLGVGIWAGLSARTLDDDAFALCPDLDAACPDAPRANELLDRRDTRALIANVSFGVAAAGAIAATIAFLTGAPEATRSVAFVPQRDGGSVHVSIGF